MFTIEKKELIENLEKTRMRLCCYMSKNFCDCKYGASGNGESTGCPELRSVISLLRIMTEKEYDKIRHKAKMIVPKEFIKAFNKKA